ncbi:LTA synthase family protein [Halobacillus halophilus]|uniref:LTA synthase family protein n=1 Tax=Halobacillus halophilus TaxID=1570 RepID=UPI001CD7012D|nr:alkaline phosphatase family protein [Halobacillus halophilus]MCA1011271.1 sulfatase-like hydrolase/transferase [Halobacillus halophilus]
MGKSLIRTFPLFLFFTVALGLCYSILTYSIASGWKTVIDWAQIHTVGLGTSILVLSLVMWGTATWWLHNRNKIDTLYKSRIYRVATALLVSGMVGAAASYLFMVFHLDITLGRATEWVQEYPERYMFTVFLLSLFTLALILIIGETYMGGGIALLVSFILALVNHYKQIYRNEPLFPNDFIQIGQLQDVIPLISDSISITATLLIIGLIVAGVYVWYKMPKIKIGWITRLVILVPVAYLLYSFMLYDDRFTESYYEEYTSFMPWNQKNNYYYNGPVLGMISNIKLDVVEKPEPYNQTVMEDSVVHAKEVFARADDEKENPKQPNIIFFMNETFWDPTNLGVNFSEDPMKNTRRLMEEYPSGQILSPSFGGETANVEFEALTSYSMSYINPGGNPFNHILANDSYPSVVSYLNDRGYYSEAIHPNGGNLYRRQRVYPNLGFDQSTFLDDMTYTKKDNKQFVSDRSVVKELLDTIEEQEQPSFIHAVTIANHLPYSEDKYEGGSTIDVSGEGLSPDTERQIEVYSEGIKRSDETLKKLNESIQEMDEPTIVVFFGDHLPSIGANLKAYKETGFGDEEDQKQQAKFYETPLLFLSNFEMDMKKEIGTVSPVYLAPMVADALHYKAPKFYDFLEGMKQELPAFRDMIYMTAEGETVSSPDELPSSTQKMLRDYQHFQYDVLTGKQHITQELYDLE